MSVRIYVGDVRRCLRILADESVQCVVTSPPYWGLRNYESEGQIGLEPTPGDWLRVMVQVFREIRRVLRKDGVVWLNIGDKYAGSGCGGDTGATSLEGSTEHQESSKRATKKRHADEIGATARKATPANVGRRATRGVHLADKQRMLLPARLAIALQDDGWWIRDEIVWSKPNPMPSSTLDRTTPAHEMIYLLARRPLYFFDPAAIAEPATYDGPNAPDKIKSPHGQGFTRAAAEPSGWDNENARHDQGIFRGRRAGNKRHKHTEEFAASANPGDRPKADTAYPMRNKRSVWTIATEPFAEEHFATFPTKLVEPCVLAGTSARGACVSCGAPWKRIIVGDDTLGWYPTCRCDKLDDLPPLPKRKVGETPKAWKTRRPAAVEKWKRDVAPYLAISARIRTRRCLVLDPFLGAGTTALVADRLGRAAAGIELNPRYVDFAVARITKDAPLFSDIAVVDDLPKKRKLRAR